MSENKHGAYQNQQPTDPKTGQAKLVEDVRRQFEEFTRATPRDPAAERAFVLTKIESVQKNHNLTDAERVNAINELRALLDTL